MKNFNEEDFEADLWEVDQTVGDIKKILNGEIDGAQILEREKQKEQRKKNAETLKKIKEREHQEKLLNGTPGKGEFIFIIFVLIFFLKSKIKSFFLLIILYFFYFQIHLFFFNCSLLCYFKI